MTAVRIYEVTAARIREKYFSTRPRKQVCDMGEGMLFFV